jgi:hypothetical protein
MDAFLASLVRDLSSFAAPLLERGLAAGQRATLARDNQQTSYSAVIRSIERLTALTPRLVSQEVLGDLHGAWSYVPVASAKSARPSRRACDWAPSEGRVIPTRWERPEPDPSLPIESLRWLLHIHEVLTSAYEDNLRRVEKYARDAAAARTGTSEWAEADRQALEALMVRLQEAGERLARSTRVVRTAIPGRARSRRSVPADMPLEIATWATLRRLAPSILQTGIALPEILAGLLTEPFDAADVCYLYQRWCGLQLLLSFERLGWHLVGDAVGALFLGGMVELRSGAARAEIWVESRIGSKEEHGSHVMVRGAEEQSPDFMILVPGPSGGDAFVLDPTMSRNPTVYETKGKYLQTLLVRHVAGGRSCFKGPLRSWAAIPDLEEGCRLLSPFDGTTGVVPLHPLAPVQGALDAWCSDVSRHAHAWGTRPDASADEALDELPRQSA